MGRILLAIVLAALILWAFVHFTVVDSPVRWLGFVLAPLVFIGGIWFSNARK